MPGGQVKYPVFDLTVLSVAVVSFLLIVVSDLYQLYDSSLVNFLVARIAYQSADPAQLLLVVNVAALTPVLPVFTIVQFLLLFLKLIALLVITH